MDESESITKGLRFMSEDLVSIADRIDAETSELPRGKDGVPIRVGETVYGEDGKAYVVCTLTLNSCDGSGQWLVGAEDTDIMFGPKLLTHERPDSLERIADDLDAWCDRTDVDGNACGEPRELADRIRRLVEMEG